MQTIQIPRRFTRHKWGGTESVVLETCKRLIHRGHPTEILTTRALDEGSFEEIEGVPVRRTEYFYPYLGLSPEARHRLDLKAGNLFSFHLLKQLWDRPELDLIHLHTGKRLGGIGRWVARHRDIPYVLSLHGGCFVVPGEERSTWVEPTRNTLEWGKVLGWWFGSRRVLADAAAVLCLSPEEAAEVRQRHPGKRVVELPNGVDCERFSSGDGSRFRARWEIPASRRILLNVGRIDAQKNQIQALRVLAGLLSAGQDVHLVLVGPCTDPDYEAALDRTLAELGLGDRVTRTGGIPAASPEIIDAYHAADLFYLPSRHEPFGIVLLEAWAAGLPVVASRVGGIPGLVRSPELGSLFDLEDEAGAVRACRELLEDPDRRQGIATEAGRTVRERYDWDRVTGELIHLYQEVVEEHRSRGRNERRAA